MGDTFGPEQTFASILKVQGISAKVLSDLYPDVVPPEDAVVLVETANLHHINPARIREIEAKGGHDVIAINTAWEEVVAERRPLATAHINKIRTSADSTEAAKALQIKRGLEVIADSTENLRDIVLERALEWDSVSHMDQTHLYDAIPTVAGRPFAHYAEMLQSGLDVLKFFHDYSTVGKWSDVTGNFHSAVDMEMDGRKIENEFCNRLGIRHMKASAQVPGREYVMDIFYSLARIGETVANLAHYMRTGRGDDVDVFRFPRGRKGSSGMPHKDRKGGNPAAEEQGESIDGLLRGLMVTAQSTSRMDYARDLSGSAYDRIALSIGFKVLDHTLRGIAEVVYKLQLNEERCKERVNRSYGVVTSPRFLAYLTDTRRTSDAMPRSVAHDLLGILSAQAYDQKKPFGEILLEAEEVCKRIPREQILGMADPTNYIGQSREIIHDVYDSFHGRRTFPEAAV